VLLLFALISPSISATHRISECPDPETRLSLRLQPGPQLPLSAADGSISKRSGPPRVDEEDLTRFWSRDIVQTRPKSVAIGDRGAQICAATQGFDGLPWEGLVFGSTSLDGDPVYIGDLLRGEDTMGDPGPFADAAKRAPVYAVAYVTDEGWNVKKHVCVYLPGKVRDRAWGAYLDQSWGTAHGVAVSDDGSTVAVMTDDDDLKTNLHVYNPFTGAKRFHWSAFGLNDIWCYGVDVSDDGSRIYVNLGIRTAIVDGFTGNTIFTGPTGSEAAFAAQSISGDGKTYATGISGRVQVFRDAGSGVYDQILDFDLGEPLYQAHSLDLDDSGENLVVAAFDFNDELTYGIWTFDLSGGSGEVVWHREFTGQGACQNVPYEVSLSGTGERFILGTWGDTGNTWPEVMVFDFGNPDPIEVIDEPGSVYSVDIDDSGLYIAVGNQTGHANEALDFTGMVHSFHLGGTDLSVYGTPIPGETIDFSISGEPGENYVLAFSTVEREGTLEGYAGTFYLETGSGAFFRIIARGIIPGSGSETISAAIPGISSISGTQIYFQAALKGEAPEGRLTNELVLRLLKE